MKLSFYFIQVFPSILSDEIGDLDDIDISNFLSECDYVDDFDYWSKDI